MLVKIGFLIRTQQTLAFCFPTEIESSKGELGRKSFKLLIDPLALLSIPTPENRAHSPSSASSGNSFESADEDDEDLRVDVDDHRDASSNRSSTAADADGSGSSNSPSPNGNAGDLSTNAGDSSNHGEDLSSSLIGRMTPNNAVNLSPISVTSPTAEDEEEE